MNRRQKEKTQKLFICLMLLNSVDSLDRALFPEAEIKPKYKIRPKREPYAECVTVYRINNLKIEIRENEGKHGRAHVHISIRGQESASIALDNFEILAGSLDKQHKKLVMQWVIENAELLRNTWEAFHGRTVQVI